MTQVSDDLLSVTVAFKHIPLHAAFRQQVREYALEKSAEHRLANWIAVDEGG